MRWISFRSCAALLVALAAVPALAQPKDKDREKGNPPAVPDDLFAVITLRGKPCGGIAKYDRQSESDYLVTCSDGHHYRVYIGPGDRVIVEDR